MGELSLDAAILPLLCDPDSYEPLACEPECLVNPRSGKRYPLRDGVPDFAAEVSGLNRKYQELYDRVAVLYDPIQSLYLRFKRIPNYRATYMNELEVKPGARVLEVSVGTGQNLSCLPPDIEFFGLDLSWGMLRRCRKNLRRWNRRAELFHGEAERLPFADAVFDVVFHVGGINFFNDRARAILEMIRVAKPGTKFLIVDETEKVVTGNYQKAPFIGKYFEKRTDVVEPPVELVPPAMREKCCTELFDGRLYCLTFRKP